jgi:hypothetical protein
MKYQEKIKKYFILDKNENTILKLAECSTDSTVLRWKFIALNVYMRKEERPKINHISFQLRKLGTEEQIKFEENK